MMMKTILAVIAFVLLAACSFSVGLQYCYNTNNASIGTITYAYGGQCTNLALIQNIINLSNNFTSYSDNGSYVAFSKLIQNSAQTHRNDIYIVNPTYSGNVVTNAEIVDSSGSSGANVTYYINDILVNSIATDAVFSGTKQNVTIFTLTNDGISNFNVTGNDSSVRSIAKRSDGLIKISYYLSITGSPAAGTSANAKDLTITLGIQQSTTSYNSSYNTSTHSSILSTDASGYFESNLHTNGYASIASFYDLSRSNKLAKVLNIYDSLASGSTPSGMCNVAVVYTSSSGLLTVRPIITYFPGVAPPYSVIYEGFDNSLILKMWNQSTAYMLDNSTNTWFFVPATTCYDTSITTLNGYPVATSAITNPVNSSLTTFTNTVIASCSATAGIFTCSWSDPNVIATNYSMKAYQEITMYQYNYCTNSTISASGSLTCNYNQSLNNHVVLYARVSNENIAIAEAFAYSTSTQTPFGQFGVWLSAIFVIFAALLFLISPEYMFIGVGLAIATLTYSGFLPLYQGLLSIGLCFMIFLIMLFSKSRKAF